MGFRQTIKNSMKSGPFRGLVQRSLVSDMQKIAHPMRLIIEPSSHCNFKCPKCLYPVMVRDKMLLDIDLMRKFLIGWKEEFGEFKDVEFTGSGEVLVNKSFPDLVQAFQEIMPHTKMRTTSNLALLTEETGRKLLRSGLRIWQVSFDSADEDEFNKFTGAKSFQKVIKHLKLLRRLMDEDNSDLNCIKLLVHRPYDESYSKGVEKIRTLVGPYCHRVSASPYQSLNGRLEGDSYYLSENLLYSRAKKPLLCDYLWKDLVVVANGDIRVCCADMFDSEVTFGNIFTDTPSEIVDNSARIRYQYAHIKSNIADLYLCNKCHVPYAT